MSVTIAGQVPTDCKRVDRKPKTKGNCKISRISIHGAFLHKFRVTRTPFYNPISLTRIRIQSSPRLAASFGLLAIYPSLSTAVFAWGYFWTRVPGNEDCLEFIMLEAVKPNLHALLLRRRQVYLLSNYTKSLIPLKSTSKNDWSDWIYIAEWRVYETVQRVATFK